MEKRDDDKRDEMDGKGGDDTNANASEAANEGKPAPSSLGLFRVDPEKEKNGAEVHVSDTLTLIIARANNDEYQAALLGALGEKSKRFAKGKLTEREIEILKPKVMKAAAEHLLVGWSGLNDDGGDFGPRGAALEYSPGMALQIFEHERFGDFYDYVKNCAEDEELYRDNAMEEDAGN